MRKRDGKVEQSRVTKGNLTEVNGIQEVRRKRSDRLENGGGPARVKKTFERRIWGIGNIGKKYDNGRARSIEGYRLDHGKNQNRLNKSIIPKGMEWTY